jgi:prephenate dehydrogenase
VGERVLIRGLSPVAATLGRALRRAGARVSGQDPDARVAAEALSSGAVDEVVGEEHAPDPSLTAMVLALPFDDLAAALARAASALPSGAVVTAISPLMLPSLSAARATPGLAGRFVPSHPVLNLGAGESARAGATARESALDPVAGATVFIGAPLEPGSAAARVADLWRSVGARPEAIAPTLHDALVALTHQLPILASAALTRAIRRTGSLTRALAPGARSTLADATRAAGEVSDATAEALVLSAPKLLPALEILEREVRRLRHSLEEGGGELRLLLEEAREFRRELLA